MDEVKNHPARNMVKFLLKAAISAVALYFVFRKVDFHSTFRELSDLNLVFFTLSILVFNVSKIISTWRIKYFLRALGAGIGNGENLRLYYIGAFYNLYLPGSIGGDGYKVWLLNKRFQLPLRKLISVVFLDRLSGMAALTAITLLLLLFTSWKPPVGAWNFMLTILFVSVYPLYSFAFKKIFPDFKQALHSSNGISILSQLLQVLCAWLILRSLDAPGNPWDYLALFMIAGVISVLPITLGGLGAREAVLASGAHYLSIDGHTAVSFALLFFFVTAVSSFAGLIFAFRQEE